MNENITILDGGILTLTNTTIEFNCTVALEFGITIEAGGKLYIHDGDGLERTRDDASLLTGTRPFFLVAKGGSVLEIRNSVISRCGSETTFPMPLLMPGGVTIETDHFDIEGTWFTRSYTGLFLDGVRGGIIRNCTFYEVDYAIMADMAEDIVVRGCDFKELGTGLYLRTTREGMPFQPIQGTFVVEGCTFTDVEYESIHIDLPRNILIAKNEFRRSSRTGIHLEGVDPDISVPFDANSTIRENGFDEVAWPIVFENVQNATITGTFLTNFTMGISLNKVRCKDIAITYNRFGKGYFGVDFNVRDASDITMRGNLFNQLGVGIEPHGTNIRIIANSFDSMSIAGILHESKGVLVVRDNRFSNSTYGIKAQRELIPRPGLSLGNNTFEGNYVGLLARDVVPFAMESGTWARNDVGVILLGMRVSIYEPLTFTDCDIGIKLVSSYGFIENVSIHNSSQGLVADLDTTVTLVECVFMDCETDALASNRSSITVVDSEHENGFRAYGDGSVIRVMWTSVLHVSYMSDGRPGNDIVCRFIPATGTDPFKHTTNRFGDIGPIRVLQALWDPLGPRWMLPYNVTLFYRGVGHPFSIRFEDGHWFSLEIDDIPPSITLAKPSDPSKVNTTRVTFRMLVSDDESGVATLSVYLDERLEHETRQPPLEVLFVIDIGEGRHEMVLNASDAWLNWCEVVLNLLVDTKPPEIIIDDPLNGTLTNLTSITVNGSIIDGDRAKVGDTDISLGVQGVFSLEVPLDEEGPNLITLRVWDEFNNTAVAVLHILRDTTPPTLDIEELPPLTNLVSAAISGTTDGVRLYVQPLGIELSVEGEFNISIDLVEGDNVFTIESVDDAGNRARAVVLICLDRRIEFEIFEPSNGATVDEDLVEVMGWGESGLQVYLVDERSSNWTTVNEDGSFTMQLEIPSFGQNNFLFELKDPAGNIIAYQYGLNRVGISSEPDDPGMTLAAIMAFSLVPILVLAYLCLRQGRDGR